MSPAVGRRVEAGFYSGYPLQQGLGLQGNPSSGLQYPVHIPYEGVDPGNESQIRWVGGVSNDRRHEQERNDQEYRRG